MICFVSFYTIIDGECYTLGCKYIINDPSSEVGMTWSGVRASSLLTIISINVSRGDCTLIISPTGNTMLIDTGMSGENLLSTLNEWDVSSIDYLVSTHFDADHIGGVDTLVAGEDGYVGTEDDVEVGVALDRGDDSVPSTYFVDDYMSIVEDQNIPRVEPTIGETFDLGGGVSARCVSINGWVLGNRTSDWEPSENDRSIGLYISFGGFNYLTCGDLTGYYEDLMAPALVEMSVDVLHLNHHGSYSSTYPTFVQTIQPENAVASVGASNSYGHPHQATFDNLATISSPCGEEWFNKLYITEFGSSGNGTGNMEVAHGNVVITSDGQEYFIQEDKYPTDILDSDGDGMYDCWEMRAGLDINLASDAFLDRDNDNLTEYEEFVWGTCPLSVDSDGDSLPDDWEVDYGLDPVTANSSGDPDGDRLNNRKEYLIGTNPCSADSDGDGMPDDWELDGGTDPIVVDGASDLDSDGASNLVEYLHVTDPSDPDTDRDGMFDGWEIIYGFNPLLPYEADEDADGDNWTNLEEFIMGTDPLVVNSLSTNNSVVGNTTKDDDGGQSDTNGTNVNEMDPVEMVYMIVGAFLLLGGLTSTFIYMNIRRKRKLP